MWSSLSRDDLRRAEQDVRRQRAEMETRHAEELKDLETRQAEERSILETKLNQLSDIERAVDSFVAEFGNGSGTELAADPARPEAEPPAVELAQRLAPPTEVEVIATNWGNTRFKPAEGIAGPKAATEWRE